MASYPPEDDVHDAISTHLKELFITFVKEWSPLIRIDGGLYSSLSTDDLAQDFDTLCRILDALRQQSTGPEINVVFIGMAVQHIINALDSLYRRLTEIKASTSELPKKETPSKRTENVVVSTEQFWNALIACNANVEIKDPFHDALPAEQIKEIFVANFAFCSLKCHSFVMTLRLCKGIPSLLPIDSMRLTARFLRLDLLKVHNNTWSYYKRLKKLFMKDPAILKQLGLTMDDELKNAFPSATDQEVKEVIQGYFTTKK